jgi:uncharacterized protein
MLVSQGKEWAMKQAQHQASEVERWQSWRETRLADLAGPDSWRGLVGLFWLKPGSNPVGSASDAVVQLPSGPAHLGDLQWADGRVSWHPVDGEVSDLETDVSGAPTTVIHESLAFFIVDRDGQLAARVRDRQWANKQPFAGLDYFPYDPAWRIEAEWQALTPPVRMEVPNVSGELKVVEVSHQAVFTMAEQTISLLPMSVAEKEVFFVFRDQTSGKESYGAGRFLKAAPAVAGKILLDFNFAFNPPCAFTAFATCPLPPAENWLSFSLHAGEKKPKNAEN